MPKTPHQTRKLSPFFLFPFTLFLTLLLSLPWVKALPTQLKYEEGKKTLEVFRDAWIGSEGLEQLRTDLAKK